MYRRTLRYSKKNQFLFDLIEGMSNKLTGNLSNDRDDMKYILSIRSWSSLLLLLSSMSWCYWQWWSILIILASVREIFISFSPSVVYKWKVFSDVYLLLILFRCLGTFLFDCEMEREQNRVREKTQSLWTYLNQEEILRSFSNPLYEVNRNVILPSVSPQSLVSGSCYSPENLHV